MDTTAGATECAARARFGAEEDLFGRDWLLSYKKNPTLAGVSVVRCRYERTQNGDFDPSAPDAAFEAQSGDLVGQPSVMDDGTDVQRIILALPDSTDGGHRCPGPQPVVDFDEFIVLDQSGTSVATFQTSEYGNGCGVFRVIPST